MKKLLSVLVVAAMLLSTTVALAEGLTGSLAKVMSDPYANQWETIWENDCSSEDKLVGGGVAASTAGFMAGHVTTYNSTENAMENFNRLDISLGGMHFAPEVIKLSFDLKVSNIQNWSFKPFANTADAANINALLRDITGAKANEWMRVNLQFTPNPTPASQSLSVWIDDNAAKTYTYQCGNRNNISWVRMDGVNGTRYMKNIKIESKRFWYTNDCSSSDKVTIGKRADGVYDGFYDNGSYVNRFTFDSAEKAVKATSPLSTNSYNLFNFGSGLETPNGKILYSFKLKMSEATDARLKLSWTTNDFDSSAYSICSNDPANKGFSGDLWGKNIWQKYNVLIDNANKTVTLWRGESTTPPANAVANTFACGSRPGANALAIQVFTASTVQDIDFWLKDIVVMRYDENFVLPTPVLTGVNAEITNGRTEDKDCMIVVAKYNADGSMKNVEIKPITALATDSVSDFVELGDLSEAAHVKVFLWEKGDLAPLANDLSIK